MEHYLVYLRELNMPSMMLRIVLAMLMPVVWNAFIVGGMLTWSLTETRVFQFGKQFWIFAAEGGLGELIVMFVLGVPFLKLLAHSRWFQARIEEA